MQINLPVARAIHRKYNKEPFLHRHAETVSGVMGYFARKHNPSREEYWRIVGMLHDVDFELHPDDHCVAGIEILRGENVPEEIIASALSHGWGMTNSPYEPTHIMEKFLYATDELTGLIWATALMRPSKSTQDLELSSVKKKFKDKKFAAGCSREVITQGAVALGWTLDDLIQETILAMRDCEEEVSIHA
ncbi:MAG: hydrolase [Defluviitaleaceae bacterium]|nr:hydrolase [Defluviitaleaceae bacterium]MCL2275636.1 hydrolase [Defluviitaleaceae bacterium]